MKLIDTIKRILREEVEVPIKLKRRISAIRRFVEVTLLNSHPCRFNNKESFVEEILSDLESNLIIFKLEGMTDEELMSFVKNHLISEIERFYIDSQEDC
jgi:hypothetical protein